MGSRSAEGIAATRALGSSVCSVIGLTISLAIGPTIRLMSGSTTGLMIALTIGLGASAPAMAQAAPTAPSAPSAPSIVVLGDSLSAEYGIARGTGWVKLLDNKLRTNHFDYNVVNASISGETTVGGKTRLPDLLKRYQPAIVIVELGANDGLRGLPLATTEANLSAIVKSAKGVNADVVLIGMRIPPNYGQDYGERFASLYPKLATQYKAQLVPFLLEGVITRPEWFQADRLHPTADAQAALLDTIWPQLKPLLKARGKRS
jgi:acyl-CoA thioesterase-1